MEQSGGMGIFIVVIVAVIISVFFIIRKKGYRKVAGDIEEFAGNVSKKTEKAVDNVKEFVGNVSQQAGNVIDNAKTGTTEVIKTATEKSIEIIKNTKDTVIDTVIGTLESAKNKDANIIMLIGGEGVGKTTLLSVMYKKFKENSPYSPFEPEKNGHRKLMGNYDRIESVSKQQSFTLTPLVDGTQGINKYDIRIEERLFTVCDTAGGLINMRSDPEFETALSQAKVIINVLDGAALMEGDKLLVSKINSPMRIRDLLNQYKGDSDYLLLFVITKCERCCNNSKDMSKLHKKFEEWHKAVLEWVKQNPNCTAMFIPVKTIGCVEFSRKERDGQDEKLVFAKRLHIDFSPEHVDKPMLYAFQYCTGKPFHPVETHFKRYGNLS